MMTIERAAEDVARRIDRRRFLRRSANVLFGAATAVAIGGAWRTSSAFADGSCPNPNQTCDCQLPPNASYCTSVNASYCNGHQCAGGCIVDKSFRWPTNGCWCTKVCCYRCSTAGSYCGYWQCCDCECGVNKFLCVCRGFTYTCQSNGALPDGIQCC